MFNFNFVSVANTGDSETMKDIANILKTYIEPFKVKDGREKTEKEAARSKALKIKSRKYKIFYNQIKYKILLILQFQKKKHKVKENKRIFKMSKLSDFLVESILNESVEQVQLYLVEGLNHPTKGHLDVIFFKWFKTKP